MNMTTNEEIARELQGVSITSFAEAMLRFGALSDYVKDAAKSERIAPFDQPEDERRKKFGARVKIMMEMRGINQTELAKQLGVHKSTISNWLAGRLEPPQRALIKIATILNVQTDWLLSVPPRQPEPFQTEQN